MSADVSARPTSDRSGAPRASVRPEQPLEAGALDRPALIAPPPRVRYDRRRRSAQTAAQRVAVAAADVHAAVPRSIRADGLLRAPRRRGDRGDPADDQGGDRRPGRDVRSPGAVGARPARHRARCAGGAADLPAPLDRRRSARSAPRPASGSDMYAKLQRLPMAFHDRWQSGQLLSRMMSDLSTVRRFLGFGLLFIVMNILQILLVTAPAAAHVLAAGAGRGRLDRADHLGLPAQREGVHPAVPAGSRTRPATSRPRSRRGPTGCG